MDTFHRLVCRLKTSEIFEVGMDYIEAYIDRLEYERQLLIDENRKILWDHCARDQLPNKNERVIHYGSLLAKGAMGAVYEIKDSNRVVKVIKKGWKYRSYISVTSEIANLKALSHENVIKLHLVENLENHIGLVFDKYTSDLFNYIYSNESISIEKTQYLGDSISKGLIYMHDLGIAHCDIKSENILLELDRKRISNVVITDFGLSTREKHICRFGGSLGFIAPEIYRGQLGELYCPFKADLFAFGCVIIELLSCGTDFFEKWLVPKELLGEKNVNRACSKIKENIDIVRSKFDCNNIPFIDLVAYEPSERNLHSKMSKAMRLVTKQIVFSITAVNEAFVTKKINMWQVDFPFPAALCNISLFEGKGTILIHSNEKDIDGFIKIALSYNDWITDIEVSKREQTFDFSGWRMTIEKMVLSPKLLVKNDKVFDFASFAELGDASDFFEEENIADLKENQSVRWKRRKTYHGDTTDVCGTVLKAIDGHIVIEESPVDDSFWRMNRVIPKRSECKFNRDIRNQIQHTISNVIGSIEVKDLDEANRKCYMLLEISELVFKIESAICEWFTLSDVQFEKEVMVNSSSEAMKLYIKYLKLLSKEVNGSLFLREANGRLEIGIRYEDRGLSNNKLGFQIDSLKLTIADDLDVKYFYLNCAGLAASCVCNVTCDMRNAIHYSNNCIYIGLYEYKMTASPIVKCNYRFSPSGRFRLLVIDDSKIARKMIVHTFIKFFTEYNVDIDFMTATSVEHGLYLFDRFAPDVVTMDQTFCHPGNFEASQSDTFEMQKIGNRNDLTEYFAEEIVTAGVLEGDDGLIAIEKKNKNAIVLHCSGTLSNITESPNFISKGNLRHELKNYFESLIPNLVKMSKLTLNPKKEYELNGKVWAHICDN